MLALSAWPDASALKHWHDADAQAAISLVCGVVGSVRSARSRYALSPKTVLDVAIKASEDKVQILESQRQLICSLAKVGEMEVASSLEKPAESVASVVDDIEVYVKLSGLVDFEEERKRIQKKLEAMEKDEAKLSKKLSNPGFLAKAAPEVVEKDRSKLDDIQKQLELMHSQLEGLG